MLTYGVPVMPINMALGSVVVIVLEAVTVVWDAWRHHGVRGQVATQWRRMHSRLCSSGCVRGMALCAY